MGQGNATEAEVSAFLERFLEAAERHGVDFWSERPKNRQFMNDSGFTKDDILPVLKSLDYANYNDGPDPDRNSSRPAGEVWEFSREFMGYDLYVKLKLISLPTTGAIPSICMSFHEQEAPMRTPLRRRRGG